MPTKLRLALSVLLILCVAAGAGAVAAMDLHELLDGLRTGAPRLMAGSGMFYGFIGCGSLVLLAGLIIDADLVRRGPAPAHFSGVEWGVWGRRGVVVGGALVGGGFFLGSVFPGRLAPPVPPLAALRLLPG